MESPEAEGFTDAEWGVWEPLIEAVRPRGKTPPKALRRTMAAIFWRHQNGAKWRAIPAEFGPWWLAVRIPTQSSRAFRRKPAGDSDLPHFPCGR